MSTTVAPGEDVTDDIDPRLVTNSWVIRLFTHTTFMVFLVDAALIVLFTLLSDNNVFWSTANFDGLARNGTQILLLSAGLTLLLGSGVIDLSVGASLVLAATVAAKVMRSLTTDSAGTLEPGTHLGPILVGLLVAVAVGVACGVVNGVIITKLGVNSLIATLGTLGIYQGIAYLLTGGGDIFGLPRSLQTGFALRKVGPIPLPAILTLLLLVALWAMIRYTRFGLHTLAVGSNMAAAERAGINTDRHIIRITMVAGIFVGLAGFMDLARFGGTSQGGHSLDGLNAVTAVVIGGTALFGGRINIFGTVGGAVLSIVLLNGLIIIDVKPFYQLIVTGVILIAAVYVDGLRRRITEYT